MSKTLEIVKALGAARKIRISDHGFEELLADAIILTELLQSLPMAENYPEAFKGPTVLALHQIQGRSIHVVWGLAKQSPDLATLITAYVPNLEKWYDGFKVRKPK